VDDEVLKRARMRALEQGTSVNAVLAERLRAYAGAGELQARTTAALVALVGPGQRRRAKVGRKRRFMRDELHER
jgi:hypothetical protein